MYKPRKTIDLVDSNKVENNAPTSRPSRSSRISKIQPQTRQASRARSLSHDTASQDNASALKPSQNTRGTTPLRTPQTRSSYAALGTAEKDRRIVQEAAVAVQAKILTHVEFKIDFLPNGLKQITTKQFISTVSFFMKCVLGNAKGNRLTNLSTEDIGQWLTQVHYPHMQSRSWLKTPNVPHAFTHLIDLMQWLTYFIPDNPEDPILTFRNPAYFINDYISNEFFEIVETNFLLWNNNQEEDQQAKNQEQLVDQLIQKRIGVASAKDVEKKLKKIHSEIVKLNKECNTTCPKQTSLLESQQGKQQQLKLDQQHLLGQMKDKKIILQRLKTELKANLKQQDQMKGTHENLKTLVGNQQTSKHDFNTMLEQCAQKRDLIKAKRETITHLKDIEYNKHLNYSRRLKQQSDVISKLNRFVHDMADILQMSNYQNICVDNQPVHEIKNNLPRILTQLEETISGNRASCYELTAELSKANSELVEINSTIARLETDLKEMDNGFTALNQRLTDLKKSNEVTSEKQRLCVTQLNKDVEDLHKENAGICIVLKSKRAACSELYKENEKSLLDTENQAEKLIDAKANRINSIRDALCDLKVECERLFKIRDSICNITSTDSPSMLDETNSSNNNNNHNNSNN